MARIFRTCQSSSAKEKLSFVKSNLIARYENCRDTERTDSGYISRSLVKCVVWTALQRGTYKVEWPKQTINKDLDAILLGDDDLLAEDSDQYDDSDGQMVDSQMGSESELDDILSHCSNDIELDSGYSSLSSPEKLFPGFLCLDSLYGEIPDDTSSGEPLIDDDESSIIARPDTDEKDMIRSSSLPPAASDMFANNDVTSDPLFSSAALTPDDFDAYGDQHEEDNSSSVSMISSSTYQYIPEDLKREPDVKLKHYETGDDLMTI
ncbi:Hypothetical protein PENO1_092270 [Penicillium occitanis (nom. inval.)]|nr:Hypothetical protein PENO1_092270 [Penicillium occitanis (nom. inval.)]PCG92136.1 hypothetical protein PENOC_094030 [Penicillium occitanis (nom. inval.)]